LFVSFFFFLREYLALFLSLLLCCGVVVVSRPVWYYKDTRARHKVMEGKQRSQKRVQKSTKAPKTVLRTRHPVTTPFIAPVLSHLFSLFPVSIKKSPVATIT
jgi:hypothetical protein